MYVRLKGRQWVGYQVSISRWSDRAKRDREGRFYLQMVGLLCRRLCEDNENPLRIYGTYCVQKDALYKDRDRQGSP